ncbi:MAG: kynureninase [Flavobacteriales bacterium]|nr:kynureninase [Flavobacteriales bacterium]
MHFENNLSFAQKMDREDPLAGYRNEFLFPEINGKRVIYFTGNSLGLQPRAAREALNVELEDWAKYGVEGHFHARNPWFAYHEFLTPQSARLVGAKEKEVVVMNGLTVNLHLLLVSFYRPTSSRFKILCEKKAFPSDQYALETQIRFHGFDPAIALVEVAPRVGEHTVRHEDVLALIDQHADQLALVMIGGVNYYTGQVFNMEEIAAAGHRAGALVGFDLAHAAGNIPLKLHDWNVDFACWCSYKYLNSGPGSVSGVFVHERHTSNEEIPRFGGWWGYDKESRFEMKPGFKPIHSAEGWQLSNAPVFSMAIHKASLDMFDKVGMDALRAKSEKLTAYLEFVIRTISVEVSNANFEIITPTNPQERGCQLSILAHGQGKMLFDKLMAEGVIVDWREPNVIRMAAVPMYNSFEDIYAFGECLKKSIS